jgi:hypothetical protein
VCQGGDPLVFALHNAGTKKKTYRLKADTEQEACDWYNTLIGSGDEKLPTPDVQRANSPSFSGQGFSKGFSGASWDYEGGIGTNKASYDTKGATPQARLQAADEELAFMKSNEQETAVTGLDAQLEQLEQLEVVLDESQPEPVDFTLTFHEHGPCGISWKPATDGEGRDVAVIQNVRSGGAAAAKGVGIAAFGPGCVLGTINGDFVKGQQYAGMIETIKLTRPLELGFCGKLEVPATPRESPRRHSIQHKDSSGYGLMEMERTSFDEAADIAVPTQDFPTFEAEQETRDERTTAPPMSQPPSTELAVATLQKANSEKDLAKQQGSLALTEAAITSFTLAKQQLLDAAEVQTQTLVAEAMANKAEAVDSTIEKLQIRYQKLEKRQRVRQEEEAAIQVHLHETDHGALQSPSFEPPPAQSPATGRRTPSQQPASSQGETDRGFRGLT